jgi:hypothetical protein
MPGWLKLVLGVGVVLGALGAYLHFVDPQLGRELLGGTPLAPEQTVTTAYKWRDAKGRWQLTDRPPPDGIPYERLETRSGDNVVPAFPTGKD